MPRVSSAAEIVSVPFDIEIVPQPMSPNPLAGGAKQASQSAETAVPFRIAKGHNHLLVSESGREYIDLLCGFGTVFLGHGNPNITAGLRDQVGGIWNVGRHATRVIGEAATLVESFFPPSHALGGFCSTGMEAAEFAMRIARAATNRRGVIGFDTSMHGKSAATASLGWPSDLLQLPDAHRLPFPGSESEDQVLNRLREELARRSISAVFVEPIHGSGGGRAASPTFHTELMRLCREAGALCVFDEIFTGFYRTGPAFCFEAIGVLPDLVLTGKAMGNGFPVSAVLVDRRYPIDERMFPGSTYSGNPLAAAAVVATLREMRSRDMPRLAWAIGATVRRELSVLEEVGAVLRGRGAMWILELPTPADAARIAAETLAAGVLVTRVGPWIRLLPAATIPLPDLARACVIVREACLTTLRGRPERSASSGPIE